MVTINDTFVRADTGLGGGLGTTSDGQKTWNTLVGDYGIVSNRPSYSVSNSLAVLSTAGDGVITVDLQTSNIGSLGIYFRVQDASNYWRVVLYRTSSTSTTYWWNQYHVNNTGGCGEHTHGATLKAHNSPTTPPSHTSLSHTHSEPCGTYAHSHSASSQSYSHSSSSTTYYYYVYIQRYEAGSQTLSTLISSTQGATQYTIDLLGTAIKVNKGATEIYNTTSSIFQTASQHGIGHANYGQVYLNSYVETFNVTVLNSPPTAPTLLAPSNASTVNLEGGYLFDWAFNDPDPGDTQYAWAFRRKIGAGAYEYWNDGTSTWAGTETKNIGSATAKTFAASKWTNGNTYNWSVKTWDTQDQEGVYASDRTVTGGTAPTVTVVNPATDIVSATALIEWTYSDAEAQPQQTYEVKIFSSVEYLASGFDPTTSAHLYKYDGTGADLLHNASFEHVDGITYRAYVRATDDSGLLSQWAYIEYTASFIPLDPPTVTSLSYNDDSNNSLEIIGHVNLLSRDDANAETSSGAWTALSANTTVARTTDEANIGVASFQLTNDTGGALDTSAESGAVPVGGTITYTVIMYAKRQTIANAVEIIIREFDENNAFTSQSNTTKTLVTTDFEKITHSFQPTDPATAFISVGIEFVQAGASELCYYDSISLVPDEDSVVDEWSPGGYTDNAQVVIQRSDDDGQTWTTVRNTPSAFTDANAQICTVKDYEAPLNVNVLYRASLTSTS